MSVLILLAMKIILNEKQYEVDEGTTLAAFIENLGQKPHGIAVAINYEVIPKDQWTSYVLADGHQLMLIHAVSGG